MFAAVISSNWCRLIEWRPTEMLSKWLENFIYNTF